MISQIRYQITIVAKTIVNIIIIFYDFNGHWHDYARRSPVLAGGAFFSARDVPVITLK